MPYPTSLLFVSARWRPDVMSELNRIGQNIKFVFSLLIVRKNRSFVHLGGPREL